MELRFHRALPKGSAASSVEHRDHETPGVDSFSIDFRLITRNPIGNQHRGLATDPPKAAIVQLVLDLLTKRTIEIGVVDAGAMGHKGDLEPVVSSRNPALSLRVGDARNFQSRTAEHEKGQDQATSDWGA